jgi:hypothetical protein
MSDTLAAITGGPAATALASAANAGPNYSQDPNISQFSADEAKLQTLFANDQTLAAKYASTNTQAPAGNPAGFASSPLQQTADTTGGAGGMVTPGGMTGAVSNDISGQSNALSSVMSAFNFDQPRTLDAYKTMIGALTTLANNEEASKEKAAELAQSSKQVVSGPDGFYVVDVNHPESATKIVGKPGKWSVNDNVPKYMGPIRWGNETVYNYTPPDGSAPSTYTAGQAVVMSNPNDPTETIKCAVGDAVFLKAYDLNWRPI